MVKDNKGEKKGKKRHLFLEMKKMNVKYPFSSKALLRM
jgi:hypothetical protein